MERSVAPPSSAAGSTTTNTTILGKYEMGQLLGRGSFAKVYQARSIADGSIVAIKVIDKEATMNASMEPRIIREVAAMRRLQHPNILKIHEVLATKSKIYLVMELATNGELFNKIAKRGRLTESSARRYFQQLVSALIFCHQNGVVHRDIKPQNLLLDEQGNLKVSDFGLSALPELHDTILHTACGTPAYTAPEVISRRGYDGAKADAWSCGVILFVFLAGFLPFDDSNLVTMYRKIQRKEFTYPPWISKSAKWLISQLLDPNPNTRISINNLMHSSWFKKSLNLKTQKSLGDLELMSIKECRLEEENKVMNAFDIISLSSGLNLSGLFEVVKIKEKRFTSIYSPDLILERVSEVGGNLGFDVERGKRGILGLEKGRLGILVEVLEVAKSLFLVELKVVQGGIEFEDVYWEEFRKGLGDVVLSWHGDTI
ncbi:Protein kinase domain [Dillenia turbinata]|uniref:non-specific serine/threonine protein kinase n=1 Tax=Dillenia turbinata TaxID=194707 RepID=A0AAN8UEK2_9MAGN